MEILTNIITPFLLGFLAGFVLILITYFAGTIQKRKYGFRRRYDTDKALSSRVRELPIEKEDSLQ